MGGTPNRNWRVDDSFTPPGSGLQTARSAVGSDPDSTFILAYDAAR